MAFTTKRNWFQFCFIIFAVLLDKIEGVAWWRSVKLAGFRFLSEWRPPPSWIYKISKFWRSARSRWQYASPYQVWQWSVKPFLEYGDLAIFQNGFSNFVDFNGRNAQDGQFWLRRLGLDDILYGCVDHTLNVFVLVIESMCVYIVMCLYHFIYLNRKNDKIITFLVKYFVINR